MKLFKILLPLLVLASLSFVLAGCPKDDKMMQNEGETVRAELAA